MKLKILEKYFDEENSILEAYELCEYVIKEDSELSDFPSDALKPGVSVLQRMSKGDTGELTTNEVMLAAKSFAFMRRLLLKSAEPLKHELDVTNIGRKHLKRPPIKIK